MTEVFQSATMKYVYVSGTVKNVNHREDCFGHPDNDMRYNYIVLTSEEKELHEKTTNTLTPCFVIMPTMQLYTLVLRWSHLL